MTACTALSKFLSALSLRSLSTSSSLLARSASILEASAL
ncbi:MAG: hypothetical protein OSP8Acid_11060 [uncultured Acidilobus sp. OSP8]|jgi:hypothetical protein|nr:MAG: hypothetical protein OSP8Acid_11060 [uncultured Acidilobus sp. OSP8]